MDFTKLSLQELTEHSEQVLSKAQGGPVQYLESDSGACGVLVSYDHYASLVHEVLASKESLVASRTELFEARKEATRNAHMIQSIREQATKWKANLEKTTALRVDKLDKRVKKLATENARLEDALHTTKESLVHYQVQECGQESVEAQGRLYAVDDPQLLTEQKQLRRQAEGKTFSQVHRIPSPSS